MRLTESRGWVRGPTAASARALLVGVVLLIGLAALPDSGTGRGEQSATTSAVADSDEATSRDEQAPGVAGPVAQLPESPTPPPVTAIIDLPLEPLTPGQAGGAEEAGDAGLEGEVVSLVNQERAGVGCPALSSDGPLAGVARAHSADMRDRNFFAHDNPSGQTPWDRAEAAGIGYLAAENIAAGQSSAAAVMQAWMGSAGHRANILNCSLQSVGVGVAYGGSYGIYWTQDFGG